MDPKTKQRYEKLRALGKVRFVLLVGVLMWGIPVMFVSQGLHYIFAPSETHNWAAFFTDLYPVRVIVWPLAGIVFGLWVWRSSDPAQAE